MTPKIAKEIISANNRGAQADHVLTGWIVSKAEGFLEGYSYREKEIEGLVDILIKALKYCAVEPELLAAENNRQNVVASNALDKYQISLEKFQKGK